ncbi:MAG: TetR/AcrR family transcriptional regulator [Leucobacter sp.]
MTDARILRTRAALRTAVIELASQKPIGEISVSELAAHAKINRVTFYKHYECPGDALTDALDAEISLAREAAGERPSDVDAYAFYVQILLDHLEARPDLYTIAFNDRIIGMVPLMISRKLTAVAEEYLTKRRKQKPAIPDIDIDVAAASIASGTIGAIWVWILEGDVGRERLFENLCHLMPSWFPAETTPRV